MAQQSAGQLVPITREVLRNFYLQFPFSPVPEHELESLQTSIDESIKELTASSQKKAELVKIKFGMETPKR